MFSTCIYYKTCVIRVKYNAVVTTAVTGDGKTWVNSRKTIERMYRVYRITVTACGETLPTALQLVRLYGPKFDGKRSPPLNSVLPTVLDVVFDLEHEHADCFATPRLTTVFEYSAESIVSLLSEACPKIVDSGVLVALDTRLTFAEWYRFVLLCVRQSRRVSILSDEEQSVPL